MADQLAIYKHDLGVELGSMEKQLQLSGAFEIFEQFGSPGFVIQREFDFVFCFENCHNFNY